MGGQKKWQNTQMAPSLLQNYVLKVIFIYYEYRHIGADDILFAQFEVKCVLNGVNFLKKMKK